MVNRVVYPCFTEEQTEAWRLDLYRNLASKQLSSNPVCALPKALAHERPLCGLPHSHVRRRPGGTWKQFLLWFHPLRTHATLVGNAVGSGLCLQGQLHSLEGKSNVGLGPSKTLAPPPLPLPVEAAGKSREGGRGNPTLV